MLKNPWTAATATVIATVAAVLLAGCTGTPTTPADSAGAGEPVAAQTITPAADPTAEPTSAGPVADEYSQVINGVLYQGTEIAPVRIGTDVPGQAPAAEAGFVVDGWKEYLEAADKYAVMLAPGYSDRVGGVNGGHLVGWYWKVFGLSRHGTVRELDNSGYQSGTYLPNREAALTAAYTVDGRVLDRAEYILVPIDDRYANIP